MADKTKQSLIDLRTRVDGEFTAFVQRLDAVALDELDYKRLYNGAFEMRSTVSLTVKSILDGENQISDVNLNQRHAG